VYFVATILCLINLKTNNMPSKKIIKSVIELKQQEKSKQEVEQFLLSFIRKAKIKGEDTTTKEFKEKVETMKNKMLGIKSKKEQRQGIGGLRGLVEDFDNLQELQDKITTNLTELDELKTRLTNDIREVKIKVNEVENKQTEVILQDDFYQEQQRVNESQKRSFNLFQLLKDEIGNVRDYFEQIVKGISSEIVQIRNKKTNHNELLGITKDQHHLEKHTLESHLGSKLMEELKRLVGGGFVDDLHKHREMTAREQGKTFTSIGRTTLSTETLNASVDGLETVFVVTYEPIFVMADGQVMTDGNGYSYSSGSITMDNPPQAVLINFYNS
jgi:hypothetical protein